ncbi:MYND-type domain-containing protein [Mycena kentingensis (nom. inval.)]|nr:MYND-type domain-containing protein [Mycena kentingensis (nom. inval.)]
MPPSRTLHPSLDRRNIERLPLMQRLRARAAMDMNESPTKLRALANDHIRGGRPLDTSAILPIVYANLVGLDPPDSATIEERLQAWGKEELVISVQRPINAIRLLSSVATDTPPAVMPTLWPHVWRWVAHLREHHPYYGWDIEGDMENIDLDVALSVVRILVPCLRSEKQSFRDEVVSTPGLAGAVFHSWSDTIHSTTDVIVKPFHDGVFDYFDSIHRLVELNRLRLDVEDAAEAARGARSLAEAIVYTLHNILLKRTPNDQRAPRFRSILNLIEMLSPPSHGHTPFWNVLLEERAAAALVLCTRHTIQLLDPPTQKLAFSVITRSLKYAMNPKQLAGAIECGLLVLISKAMTQNPAVDMDELGWLAILQRGLAHRAVVAAVQRVRDDLEPVLSKLRVTGTPVAPYYERLVNFITLHRFRYKVLEDVRRRESECSYEQCPTQIADAGMRRCASCCEVFYCSRECQRKDWRSGHRDACADLAPSLTVLRDPPRLMCQYQLGVIFPGGWAVPVPPPPAGTPDFSRLMFGRNAPFLRAVVEHEGGGGGAQRVQRAGGPGSAQLHVVVDWTGEVEYGATTVMQRMYCGQDVPAGYTVVCAGAVSDEMCVEAEGSGCRRGCGFARGAG